MFIGCHRTPLKGVGELSYGLTPGTTVGSFWLEDAGDWADFEPGKIPNGWVVEDEERSARRIKFNWTAPYSITTVAGDTQLSNIEIDGAKRHLNTATTERKTRGRLTYSINSVGTTRIVRWWAGNRLVAEGSRTGNGAVTCSQINGSGLTVTCDLTYTGDLPPGTAFVEVRWPSKYQVHYSTGSLSFPRTPETEVEDQEADDYEFHTRVLSGGTYNCNVLTVDDTGNVQSGNFLVSKTAVIRVAPTPPTITGVTGNAAALTVHWTPGEYNCEYWVFSSFPNEAINFGDYRYPRERFVDFNLTSCTLDPIEFYQPIDRSSYLQDVKDAFDDAMDDANAAFSAGEATFEDLFQDVIDDLKAAIQDYDEALDINLNDPRQYVQQAGQSVLDTASSIEGTGLTADEWKDAMAAEYSRFLGLMGELLDHAPGRYVMPNAGLSGGSATDALGTGSNDESVAAYGIPEAEASLVELCDPVVLPARIWIVVRAQNLDGVRELNHNAYMVEFDADGEVVGIRPNQAYIESWTASDGLTVSVTAAVFGEDEKAIATDVNLYVTAVGDTVDPETPQATDELSPQVFLRQTATLSYTVPDPGWFNVQVAAVSGDGVLSDLSKPVLIYVEDETPDQVQDFTITVIRGTGAEN
jgi:hypothetical protein